MLFVGTSGLQQMRTYTQQQQQECCPEAIDDAKTDN